jgi:hypothetical protein
MAEALTVSGSHTKSMLGDPYVLLNLRSAPPWKKTMKDLAESINYITHRQGIQPCRQQQQIIRFLNFQAPGIIL